MAKAKTAAKIEKAAKCDEEPDNQSTDSFSNYDSRQLLADTCITKRKPSFQHDVAKFGLTATSLFEICVGVELRQH